MKKYWITFLEGTKEISRKLTSTISFSVGEEVFVNGKVGTIVGLYS